MDKFDFTIDSVLFVLGIDSSLRVMDWELVAVFTTSSIIVLELREFCRNSSLYFSEDAAVN